VLALQVLQVHPFGIAGHADDLRLHRCEGLQCPEVGRRLDQHAAAGIGEHLGHQVQALLRAGGDQDLGRVDLPGQPLGHHLDQRLEALAGGVLQRGLAVGLQHLLAGTRELADRKGLRRGQAAAEADDAGPFGDLQDLADHRRVHALGAAGQHPGVAGGGGGCHAGSPPVGP
jgi:hypothetical protein